MKQLHSHWTEFFLLNVIFDYFLKIFLKNARFIKIGQKEQVLYVNTHTQFSSIPLE